MADASKEPDHLKVPEGQNVEMQICVPKELAMHFNKTGFDPHTALMCVQAVLTVVGAMSRGDIRAQQFIVQNALRVIDKSVADAPTQDVPPPDSDFWKK